MTNKVDRRAQSLLRRISFIQSGAMHYVYCALRHSDRPEHVEGPLFIFKLNSLPVNSSDIRRYRNKMANRPRQYKHMPDAMRMR